MAGCALCPRACEALREEGERGTCAAGADPVVSHVMLHEWEEPPLSGSVGSGAVFFAGCPLGCVYCQNHAISRGAEGTPKSVQELAEVFLDLEARGALNVNLVTPTHFAPAIRRAVRLARKAGLELPIIWNTSGYETAGAIQDNEGIVDVYLTDFKYADAALASALSQTPDYPQVAVRAIHEMLRRTRPLAFDEVGGEERMISGVVVRHLVLPGHVRESCQALRLLRDEFGDDVRLSIMSQYTPQIPEGSPVLDAFPELARRVTPEEYEAVLDQADALGFEDYFWQEGDPAQESFIPAFS